MSPTTWLRATALEPAGDPGHLIPDEVWAAVVAAVEAPEQPAGLYAVPDRTISARSHGGIMPGGPRMGVLHSAETPLRAGYAYSISANWFATQATTSATVMIDPAETIRLLPDNVVSYAVGPRANGFTINVEQAGYARLTYAEWTTPAGRQQMARVALFMRECRDRWGIPLRWATDEQIRAAAAGSALAGWCQHDDVRRVLGGTTHHDPTPHYPLDELMELARGTTPLEDNEMTPEQATLLGNIGWRQGQDALALAALINTVADEDAQTDLMLWALTDENAGVRAQNARTSDQLTGIDAKLAKLTGDSPTLRTAPAEDTSAPSELLAAVRARMERGEERRAKLRELAERLQRGPTEEELAAILGNPVPAVATA